MKPHYLLLIGMVACTTNNYYIEETEDAQVPDSFVEPDAGVEEDAEVRLDAALLEDATLDSSVPDAALDSGAPDAAPILDASVDAPVDAAPDVPVVRTRGTPVRLWAQGNRTEACDNLGQLWRWGDGVLVPTYVGACPTDPEPPVNPCTLLRNQMQCGGRWYTPPLPYEASTYTYLGDNCYVSGAHMFCWGYTGAGGSPDITAWAVAASTIKGIQIESDRYFIWSGNKILTFTPGFYRSEAELTVHATLSSSVVDVRFESSRICKITTGITCTTNRERTFDTEAAWFQFLSREDPVERPITGAVLGANHACAFRRGRLVCSGDNSRGQLGTGTTTSSADPVFGYFGVDVAW